MKLIKKFRKMLKKWGILVLLVTVLVFVVSVYNVRAKVLPAKTEGKCITIQDGSLVDVKGDPITTGVDQFGYNYQAHLFLGRYCDYDRVPGGEYCDDKLEMKWNDAWLANKSCDGDNKLDRHFGFPTYRGSGAWLTNHQWGEYQGTTGKTCKWDYFVKIVAAPTDAKLKDGIWYTAAGEEIGPVEWGEFAVIQQVYNDPCAGKHGKEFVSPEGPGFGKY